MILTSKNKFLISLITTILLAGCSYIESTTQIRDIAYLRFGNIKEKEYTVVVNESRKFQLDSNDSKKLYEIPSGNITLKITDGDKIVLMKSMYISSGNTVEITW
jgi:hypothetical protein